MPSNEVEQCVFGPRSTWSGCSYFFHQSDAAQGLFGNTKRGFLTCRAMESHSQTHPVLLSMCFKMSISRKSKSMRMGLQNPHFNIDPQIILTHIQVWESLDWSSWIHFEVCELHSTFCASVMYTLFREYLLLDSGKGALILNRQRTPAGKKKKEIGILSCHFLVFDQLWGTRNR